MSLIARAIVAHVLFLMTVIGLYLFAAKAAFNLGEEPDLHQHSEKTPRGKLYIAGRIILFAVGLTALLVILVELMQFQNVLRILVGVLCWMFFHRHFILISLQLDRRWIRVAGIIGSTAVVCSWYFWPSWWTLDILAGLMAWSLLCVFCRQTFKTALTVAVAVVLYDVGAVFVTGRLVDFSVQLVEPLTETDPCASTLSSAVLPMLFVLPFSISNPYASFSVIGLGDVVLPGILVMVAIREAMWFKAYTIAIGAFLGYVGGFFVGALIGAVTGSPQPLTLYLFPWVIVGIVIPAWRAGILSEIINPPPEDEEEGEGEAVENPEDEASPK